MTAVAADPNLARLRALAEKWRGDYRPESADELDAVLGEIEAAKSAGGDLLRAFVKGDSIPELHDAALLKGVRLWGADAVLEVEATGTISTPTSRRWLFSADVYVRCLNYFDLPAPDPEAGP